MVTRWGRMRSFWFWVLFYYMNRGEIVNALAGTYHKW